MNAEGAEAAGLPCMVILPTGDSKCPADVARKRLAAGGGFSDVERSDLDFAARGCVPPFADPFDPALQWGECPGKAAFHHPDVEAALTVRRLASLAPLRDWPDGYAARVVETWSAIEGWRS